PFLVDVDAEIRPFVAGLALDRLNVAADQWVHPKAVPGVRRSRRCRRQRRRERIRAGKAQSDDQRLNHIVPPWSPFNPNAWRRELLLEVDPAATCKSGKAMVLDTTCCRRRFPLRKRGETACGHGFSAALAWRRQWRHFRPPRRSMTSAPRRSSRRPPAGTMSGAWQRFRCATE